jgi:hypothetical protein
MFRFDAAACSMTPLGGGAVAGYPNGTRSHHVAGLTAGGEILVQGGVLDGAPDAAALRLSL